MSQRGDGVGITLVILSAVGFGLNGPFARIASDLGFNAISFASWRSMASVVTLVLLLAAGILIGRASWAPLGAIRRLEWVQLAAMGLFVAGTTLGLYLAFERLSIALTLIVFYSYPIIVALAAAELLGEPLGARRLGAILLASVGMVLLLAAPGSDDGGFGVDLLGVLFALIAAASQTGYALVASRGFASVPSLQAATFLRGFSMVLYFFVFIPFVLLIGESEQLFGPLDQVEAWSIVLIVGILAAGLPTAGLVAGYRRVGPTRGAILMLAEPVTGVLIAAIWFAERPGPVQLLGGLLVLVGAVLVQVLAPTRPSPEPEPSSE